MRIDLNADVGESYGAWSLGEDEALIPLVTSVNVACGAHAGDPDVIARTVALAARHGVAVGAHPGLSGPGRASGGGRWRSRPTRSNGPSSSRSGPSGRPPGRRACRCAT